MSQSLNHDIPIYKYKASTYHGFVAQCSSEQYDNGSPIQFRVQYLAQSYILFFLLLPNFVMARDA